MTDDLVIAAMHVRTRGRVSGPYDLSTLRQMARRAQIGTRTEVSPDGFNWGVAGDYPAIFETPETNPTKGTSVDKWHFSLNGVQQPAPIELAVLQQYIAAGTVNSDDRAWKDGMTDWASIGSIAELAMFLPKTQPEQIARKPGPAEVFCRNCGAIILANALICPQCGCSTKDAYSPPTDRINGLGVAGIICGILSIIPIPFFCLILALIGLVLSAVGARRQPRGLAVAGIILSTLTLAFQVLVVVVILTGNVVESFEWMKVR